MSESDQTGMLSLRRDYPSDAFLAYDDLAILEERSADDLGTGITSLGFLRGALRRGRRFWCAMAVIGLLAGIAFYKLDSPAYQASTTILLTQNPAEDPLSAMQDDQAIAQSRAVAGRTVRQLGLSESTNSFLAAYTAAIVTDRILLIAVKAPSSSDAVRWANAVAKAFLQFRADQVRIQQQQVLAALRQQITQARQHIGAIDKQISQLPVHPALTAVQAQRRKLVTERTDAAGALTALIQTTNASQATTDQTAAAMIENSQILDPATPIVHSRLKLLLEYAVTGLIIGLVLGVAIVVIRALVSDRLRRRDDVARALGSSVNLSVGTVHLSRWWPSRRGMAAADSPEVRRIAQHLGRAVLPASRGVAALAVVPVDDLQVAALSLVSLALSCAQDGHRVVVADLCPGSPAARLIGLKEPGVHVATVHDAHLTVVVPDPDDVAPVGPLSEGRRRARPDPSAAPLFAACASASLLLTLASLDPAMGAEHLAGWADGAVAVVTAGESSATAIIAAGEMIRLAGMPLVSAVLVGSDKSDKSLGVLHTSSPLAAANLGVTSQ